MKKAIALLAALCLLLACVPALAVSPAEVLGDWYLCYRLDETLIPVPTANVKLTFNRDSTVNISFEGEESTSAWSIRNDYVWVDEFAGSSESFELMDKGLKVGFIEPAIDAYSHYYIFCREPIEAEVFPEPIVAEQEDDFFGDWIVDYYVDGGVRYTVDETVLASIEFAQITLTQGEDSATVLTDYQDGKLLASAYDLGLAYDKNIKAVAQLTTDGSILLTLEGEGVDEPPYYLTRFDSAIVIPEPAEVVEAVEEEAAEETSAD